MTPFPPTRTGDARTRLPHHAHRAHRAARRACRLAVRRFRRFQQDEAGQDVLEYGLLAALIGVVALGVWLQIQDALHDLYVGYDTGIQGLWQPENPGGGA